MLRGPQVTVYFIYTGVYNLYFHSLAHIPGPLLARATPIPYIRRIRNGQMVPWLEEMHRKYGDVVRVTPTEVSFVTGETAWPEIYGFRTGKNKTGSYLKDREWFATPPNGVYSMIAADDETHSRMRRNLSHAFSDKALREQEGLVQNLVNLLTQRLHEEVDEKKPVVDIMRWVCVPLAC